MTYKTHVFDCDGVLIASNAAKSQAFYETALPYGEDAAQALVAYHKVASGSRENRWEYFFAGILEREPEDGELERVVSECTHRCMNGVREAEKVPGVEDYLASIDNAVCVSGVNTDELRTLIAEHGLTHYFSAIFGGPRGKSEVLRRLISDGTIALPAVYYGDTEADYIAAKEAGLDFVLVTGDAEWDWEGSPAAVVNRKDFTTTPQIRRGKVRVDRDGFAGDVYVGRSLAGAEVTL